MVSKLQQPVGAELRGTTAVAWRGMTSGLRKDQGFFAIPAASRLPTTVLCEWAIDVISCHALHPQYRCLSTAGARPSPAWPAELLAQVRQVYCGFDLDVDSRSSSTEPFLAFGIQLFGIRQTHHEIEN